MAYHPDDAYWAVKTELVSDDGRIKYAAHYLFGYYCLRRNKNTGLCFPSLSKTVEDTGLPKSNVSMLKSYLEDIGWIYVYETGVIRPLKGFYPDEEIFKIRVRRLLLHRVTVLIIRTEVLTNRTLVLLIRTLFKGNLNQPIEPANLTSFSADSPKAASADKNFENNFPKNGLSPDRADAKPNGKSNSKNGSSPQRGETEPDARRHHPAIVMVKEISSRYPHKDQWDKVIREIGDNPDIEFFQASWEIWRSFDGKPTNLQGWLFKPNEKGKLPEIFGKESPPGNGNSPPGTEDLQIENEPVEVEPLTDRTRRNALVVLGGIMRGSSIEALQSLKSNYTEDDWQWLMTELPK